MIIECESPDSASDRSSAVSNREDFAELSRTVRAEGLLTRRRGYYGVKIGLTVGALGLLAVAAAVVGNSWWNVVVAVGLAFTLTQLGFIGHDAGHRQICAQRRHNDAIGLAVANLLTGFSFGWWLTKHNRHHAHTNRPDKDPDMAPGVLVYVPDQLEGRGRFGRLWASAQVVMLVPLLFLEAINLHVASVVSLAHRRDRAALVEAGLLVVHFALFFVAPFLLVVARPRRRLHRRHPVTVRLLPGHQLPDQPRGDAHAGRGRRAGLPAPPGGDIEEPVRHGSHRVPLRGPRHPDRAPPVPDHAEGQSAPGPVTGPAVLP